MSQDHPSHPPAPQLLRGHTWPEGGGLAADSFLEPLSCPCGWESGPCPGGGRADGHLSGSVHSLQVPRVGCGPGTPPSSPSPLPS